MTFTSGVHAAFETVAVECEAFVDEANNVACDFADDRFDVLVDSETATPMQFWDCPKCGTHHAEPACSPDHSLA